MILKDNYAYGMYEVGTEAFVNKSDALFRASTVNKDVHWNFHDRVFSSVDWKTKPAGSIRDLYKLRAQQIRDSYDYIVVHFSGGADSWTVLNSFLSNGIHVDEVYTRWSRKEEKYKPDVNNIDRSESNLQSEYHYAVKPVLDEIAKKFPLTKIYIDDYSESFERDLTESDVKHSGHYFCMGTFHRFSRKSPYEQEAVKNNKKVAVVYGFDKLQCQVENNQFYATFIDRFGGTDIDPERSVEFFYWTPSMPLIPVMQAHILKEYYEQNVLDHISKMHVDPGVGREIYISLCYPDYNLKTFQVGKQFSSLIWKSELWVAKHNPRYYYSWKWASDQYIKTIDKRFCTTLNNTDVKIGYKPMYSNRYLIGAFGQDVTFILGH